MSVPGNRTRRRAGTADAAGPRPAGEELEAGQKPGAAGAHRAVVHPRPVHRWRDLDPGQRAWAIAVAAALALAPAVALLHYLPVWSPQADPALMALRALDTGTVRTPLVGQPSQAGVYADGIAAVHHPGPLHLYLLALPVRVLGGTVGMLTVSAVITGTCLVTSAWAVFRQLGRTPGIVAAVALSTVAFTTGASSLVNPVSSGIARYPLLLSAVLCWCVAAGDVRLLPLATAATSFTAQQHLSVVPATAVIVLGALGLLAVAWRRDERGREPASRRELRAATRWSAVVALVLWSPVVAQQAFGGVGNLGEIVRFARHRDAQTLGLGQATWQVAHAIGLPPLLGRTRVTGSWLISRPSAFTWVSAAVVVAVVAGLCLRWRATDPRRSTLGAMVAVLVVAGLYNGSSVPVGLEQARLSFYHWTFALAFFVALVVGLAAAGTARRIVRMAAARTPHAGPVLAAVTVVVVAAPGLVNPHLDRPTNELPAASAYLEADVVDLLADAGVAHADALGPHPVVLVRNPPPYVLYGPTLSFALLERGVDVRFPLTDRSFVHDDHLVDRRNLSGGLVLVVEDELPGDVPPGELIARADLATGLAIEDYRALVGAAEAADTAVLGDEVTAGLTADERLVATALVEGVLNDPARQLLRPQVLGFLADHPPLDEPRLDPDAVARLLDSLDGRDTPWQPGTATTLHLYLLDREQMLDTATPGEIGRPG